MRNSRDRPATAGLGPIALCTALVLSGAACGQDAPTTTEAQPSASYRSLATGLLMRPVYSTRNQVTVEIWDLMVGPGKSSEETRLPGDAVLEVRSGAGLLRVGTEERKLTIGSTTTLTADQAFRLQNGSPQQALMLRAVIVRN